MRRLQMMTEEEVKYLVIHCSATRCDRDYTEEMLLRDHLARHFRGIGYHFYIRRMVRRRSTECCWKWVLIVYLIIDAVSASAMRVDWTSMANLPIRSPKSRRSKSAICSSISISFSQKRRLWGIVTCRVPHLRNVLVLIPMPYSGG